MRRCKVLVLYSEKSCRVWLCSRVMICCSALPGAGCCGALRFHLNDQDGGRQDMRALIDAWWPAIERGDVATWLEFLLIGSAAGSVFAALTFAIAAFSLPMIADRDVDMVTAGVSSVNAVLRNKLVALQWAGWIALLTALGFLTAFLGLVLVMPWLAYATWHAYRETLDASDWPRLD